MQPDSSILQVAEFTSLSELASLMNIAPTELVQKCFDLGTMVSINQRLDAEIIELLAEEFGFQVKFINVLEDDEEAEEIADAPESLLTRPPIVTIMGHVTTVKHLCWITFVSLTWWQAKKVVSPSTSVLMKYRQKPVAALHSWILRVTKPSPPCGQGVPN